MFLIMSAAYITQELRSEFGALPPSFLPLGNRRLFQHQVRLAPENTPVFLTVPESFKISYFDQAWLDQNKITIIPLPDGLSLGASLVAALNLIEQGLETPLHVLFGDTLVDPLPHGDDLVAVANVEDNYDWAIVTENDDNWLTSCQNTPVQQEHEVVTGYFKFSSPRQLIRCITQSNWQFLEGLGRYRKAVGLSTSKVPNWLDFGHANTYYRSKSAHTTQRVFNHLKITPDWIEKSGNHGDKIEAEANWFESLPQMVRRFTPQYLGRPENTESGAYRLEYLHHTALNELFVFADVPALLWKKIFKECLNFLTTCVSHPKPEKDTPTSDLNTLFTVKTETRLRTFCEDRGLSADNLFTYRPQGSSGRKRKLSINDLVRGSQANLPKHDVHTTLIHGDFCFSNILYEFRTNRIKVIDPRGMTPDGTISAYGDIRYDLAKLSHSILGMYDWIIAGYHNTCLSGNDISITLPESAKHHDVQQLFLGMLDSRFSITHSELYAMQVQLFLSMLPLHADDPNRQNALFANAFRLYDLMERHSQ
ncbi:capsular biosynthesis protein [Marinobacter sp. NSM]|uniref:capsular biosynthesis protein n=1 Tax=Marinobacter sp. NSM TaxID=3458004 RepID=UPI00403529F0